MRAKPGAPDGLALRSESTARCWAADRAPHLRGGGPVLVLNASMEVLAFVSWQRAVVLTLSGDADVYEQAVDADGTPLTVASPSTVVALPAVVVLRRYVHVPFEARAGGPSAGDRVSRFGVMARDGHRCAYCSGAADTLDHVLPRSRGGADSWDNLVACCVTCNQTKGARTPAEAGMRLRREPYRPDRKAAAQRRVWRSLSAA